jgi:hypothetical protein
MASIETKLSVDPEECVPVTTIFSVCAPSASPVRWNRTAWF